MKIHSVQNEKVKVGVTEECGHLYPVQFFINNKIIEPLNVAPWTEEKFEDDSIPPMLKMLRGDFFCAPFGDSNLLESENRAHGSTANEKWYLVNKDNHHLEFKLDKKVMGAEVLKKIFIKPEQSVIYQKHQFIGGNGKIPVGHHLMLKVPEKVYLSFSNYLFGETPPSPVETDPALGNSVLAYPQKFNDLSKVKTVDGKQIDLSRYPAYQNHEDLLVLKSDETLPFAWSTASAPKNGWLWFSIKNPKELKYTTLWLSNGGRKYSPFSSRHRKVIGIEETTSYFHLGHKASIEKNHLSENGYLTCIELKPEVTHSFHYIFGLTPIPKKFKYVSSIKRESNGILIKDELGVEIKAPLDFDFLNEKI
jgi:hypothetical protein